MHTCILVIPLFSRGDTRFLQRIQCHGWTNCQVKRYVIPPLILCGTHPLATGKMMTVFYKDGGDRVRSFFENYSHSAQLKPKYI